MINLQWRDIDISRRVLKISHKRDWSPKSSEREIPISDGVFAELKRIRPTKCLNSEYVFTNSNGDKYGAKIRETLVRTARRAGIENLTKIHTLRHTFASQLVMNGVDLPTVKELMGHSDIQTTMIYAHLAPSHIANLRTD